MASAPPSASTTSTTRTSISSTTAITTPRWSRSPGQPLSPCVEIDGVMLADVSGEEVENYLLSNDLVKAD
jgi:hypothetical protein